MAKSKPVKKCPPWGHVYPARATGKRGVLGFIKYCLNCGKPSVRL